MRIVVCRFFNKKGVSFNLYFVGFDVEQLTLCAMDPRFVPLLIIHINGAICNLSNLFGRSKLLISFSERCQTFSSC